ncbi:MAG TPA: NifB/NifX family molybdenum-iron cluster-binding protein [Spirochaetota bacterium]|nr:NifB/NifX family molybdenum-iron cluster-binding protein [Spirochaetota bacterium]HPJ34926.1 NifB/NifX family molybdenum-iron cluster-binding protein [Spirochaetota bacterium]
MKIAIPVANGRLCMHFGHCEQFVVFDIDKEKKSISGNVALDPPPHEPGVLPQWLSEQGVSFVIAGGMGGRAISLFKEKGIDVITGAPTGDPSEIVEQFLAGTLATGSNTCDH